MVSSFANGVIMKIARIPSISLHFNKHSDDSGAGVPLPCLREEELDCRTHQRTREQTTGTGHGNVR